MENDSKVRLLQECINETYEVAKRFREFMPDTWSQMDKDKVFKEMVVDDGLEFAQAIMGAIENGQTLEEIKVELSSAFQNLRDTNFVMGQ